jgi:D-tyrosyl-tRNA(Tyr) deacylase
MRTVVQRVTSGRVEVAGHVVGEISAGLLVLVGVERSDTEADIEAGARKIVGLRVFRDDEGKMNRSLADIEGSMLVVSQFTLAGDVRKGRRPSFVGAADPSIAEPLCERFCAIVEDHGIRVERGVFGADMKVCLVNDGPVTILVNTTDGVVV